MPVVLSPLQQTAFALHDMGLNIFPQPIGKKGGFPWKALQFIRLDRDNPTYGLEQVFAGNSNLAVMCGRTSGNLFVIDCESPAALRYHMQQLRQRRIPLWVVQTARGGHIYLRAADGEVHNVAPGILKDAEIKGQMGYVLAPPSVHPSGAVYTWLHQEGQNIPVVSAADIDWLRNQTGDSVTLQVTSSHSYTPGLWKQPRQRQSQLSHITQEYIQQGHSLPEGSRNNRLFAAACDLAGNGHSEQDALRTLLPIAHSSGLPEREIQNTVASAYSKPRTPSRENHISTNTDDRWWKMLAWTRTQPWQNRTGSTDRVMMLALIERARIHANEKGIFRASIRELAELGRMGSATVQRSLKRLLKQQIIFKAGFDKSSNASLWKFNQKLIHETQLQMDTLALSPHWLSYSVSIFNSELAERGVVGRSVMYVYTYLLLFDGHWLPSSLAESVGITVNQANYALRKLAQLGLIVREKEGWRVLVNTITNAENLLASQGTDMERGARRRQRFQEERARFAGRLLVNARLRSEGAAYYHAAFGGIFSEKRIRELLDDPVIALGLELGGVVRLENDWVIMKQLM